MRESSLPDLGNGAWTSVDGPVALTAEDSKARSSTSVPSNGWTVRKANGIATAVIPHPIALEIQSSIACNDI